MNEIFWEAKDEAKNEASIERLNSNQFLLTTDGPMGYPTPTVNLDRLQAFALYTALREEFADTEMEE